MTLIEHILKTLKPELDRMIQTSIEHIEKEQKHPVSKFEAEWIRLSLIYDMTRALEHYTLPTDTLKKLSTQRSSKGSLTIDAVIERNGDEYPFYTEVIFAGGYNIQRLHYRYLTKTRLPQTRNDTLTKQLKAKLQKLSKGERLQKDITEQEKQIERITDEMEVNKTKSDKDIIEIIRNSKDTGWMFKKWEDISDEAPIKSHPKHKKTKQEFEADQLDHLKNRVIQWKKHNISYKDERIKSLEKSIGKMKIKLNSLV